MRRLLIIAAAVFAAAVQAQSVTLVSPTTISIPVSGDKAQLRVFYTAPANATAVITGDGPIVAGTNIGFAKSRATTPSSFVIEVRASRKILRPGATRTANVIFHVPGSDPVTFPVTITRPAVTFTATPSQTDICLGCGEPRVVTVKITNGGDTPIAKMKIGEIEMSDASRKHRWISRSHSEVNVAIAPGDTRTIAIAIKPPPFAGDYATTIELSAEGSATVSVSLVVRIRGPWGQWSIPLILFLGAVIAGGMLAHILEHFFGSGGGETRSNALISLHATSDQLNALKSSWASDLVHTHRRLAADIDQVDLLIRHAEQRTPADLQAQAAEYALRLEKRQRLRQKLDRTSDNVKRVKLDAEPDTGSVTEYDERLEAILAATVEPQADAIGVGAKGSKTLTPAERQQVEAIKARRKRMRILRWITLGVVSVATAYLALYFNKCSYGTVADYITAFFWGLGLTQAGNALTAEGRSKYTPPPAEGETANGAS